jgi:hypothetical protein
MTNYCIKDNYTIRPIPIFHNDITLKDEYQDEVYKYAKEIFIKHKLTNILDLGCGSAYKLFKYFHGEQFVGIEIEPTLTWLQSTFPSGTLSKSCTSPLWVDWNLCIPIKSDLVICADMIEHVQNPDNIFDFISKCNPNRVIISTPDRGLLPKGQEGPPNNPCHVREWTFHEFNKYISSKGWQIHNHFISNKEQGTQVIEASCY